MDGDGVWVDFVLRKREGRRNCSQDVMCERINLKIKVFYRGKFVNFKSDLLVCLTK